MPKNNRLYYFIEKQKTATPAYNPIENADLVNTKDRQGHSYFRFDLKFQKQPIYFDYQFTEHHLSIYQNLFDRSEYHYTAYFSNQQKEQFQLHVFFDEKDQPYSFSFQKRAKDGKKFVYHESDGGRDLSQEWSQLALRTCNPLINIIRSEFNQYQTQLEQRFQGLETEVDRMSESILGNLALYNQKVEESCEVLKELHALTTHHHYQGMILMLRGAQKFFEIQHSKFSVGPEPICAAAAPILKDNSTQYMLDILAVAPKSVLGIEIGKRVSDLKQRFEACKDAMRAGDAIQEIDEFCKELDLLGLEVDWNNEHKIPEEVNSEFYALRQETYKMGTRILNQALESEQWDKAKGLAHFHHRLQSSHLIKALESRNANLLDFLLTYGQYLLNNQPMTIAGVHYTSAVDYCFQHSEIMIDCFKVLLKHKASITLAAESDLPIAYKILSNAACPLNSVVSESKLVREKDFYQKLVSSLTCFLIQNSEAEQALKKGIKKSISEYKEIIKHLKDSEIIAIPRCLKETSERLSQEIIKSPIGPMIMDVKQDPKFQKLSKEVRELQNQVLKISTPAEKKKLKDCMHKYLELMTERMDSIVDLQSEDVLPEVYRRLNEHKEYLLNSLRYKELTTQINSTTVGVRGKLNNTKRREHEDLGEEIRAYAKKIESEMSVNLSEESEISSSFNQLRSLLENLSTELVSIQKYVSTSKANFETFKDELEGTCAAAASP